MDCVTLLDVSAHDERPHGGPVQQRPGRRRRAEEASTPGALVHITLTESFRRVVSAYL